MGASVGGISAGTGGGLMLFSGSSLPDTLLLLLVLEPGTDETFALVRREFIERAPRGRILIRLSDDRDRIKDFSSLEGTSYRAYTW